MIDRYLTDALQDDVELKWFCELLAREGVLSYLEIGSRFGGSLWRIANSLPNGSRVVSIDLPHGKPGKESQPSLEACGDALRAAGYDAHILIGNSRAAKIIDTAKALGPYDAMLIDGDHTMIGVMADWKNYGSLGRIVAFHDIAWKRSTEVQRTNRIDVSGLWQILKYQFRSAERINDPKMKDNGIGVLWRS